MINSIPSSPAFDAVSIIIVAAVFFLGLCLLCYWTWRLIAAAISLNQSCHDNVAPSCICICFSILTAGAALIAVIGIWQLYAGLYL